jgi:SlyX protein
MPHGGAPAAAASAPPPERGAEPRLNELEAKMSLAEDLLEELNRALYRQQQQIDRMQQDIRALRQQLRDAAPAEARRPDDEIPPHY